MIAVPSKTVIETAEKEEENCGKRGKRSSAQPDGIFDRQAKHHGTSCRRSVHLANPNFSTLVSSPLRRILPRARSNRSWAFSRSTLSAGTPRELSAKRQYALPRRLLHPLVKADTIPLALPGRTNPSPRAFSARRSAISSNAPSLSHSLAHPSLSFSLPPHSTSLSLPFDSFDCTFLCSQLARYSLLLSIRHTRAETRYYHACIFERGPGEIFKTVY